MGQGLFFFFLVGVWGRGRLRQMSYSVTLPRTNNVGHCCIVSALGLRVTDQAWRFRPL